MLKSYDVLIASVKRVLVQIREKALNVGVRRKLLQGVQECSIPCFKNILKYQINNEPNYNTSNRMFDICSSYCENFIYITLSIAM